MLSVQFYVLDSHHVMVKIRKYASQRAQNLVDRVNSPPLDFSWHITFLQPLLSCQIYPVSCSRMVILEQNFLTATSKSTETRNKKH